MLFCIREILSKLDRPRKKNGVMSISKMAAVGMLFCIREILSKLDRPRKKNGVMSIYKMADLGHLGF